MNPKLAKNYNLITDRIRERQPLFVVLGDGNLYKAVYEWRKEPDEKDIVAFFDIRDELQIGYVSESEWDSQFGEWFFTCIKILPYLARMRNRTVVSRDPALIPFSSVECVFRKVKKATKK